ncbi:MAG: hypothetical protein K4571_16205 [Deltaproteobacteria bacterium]
MEKHNSKNIFNNEYYRLWWEYLNRSSKYKEFCDNYGELEEEHFGEHYEVFSSYMRFYGDVFSRSFNEWCEEPRRIKGKLPRARPVLDLRDKESYRSNYFKALKPDSNLAPSLPDPKKIHEIINNEDQYIFLAVPVVGREDMATISEQIKKIRDKYRKTTTVKEADKELRKFNMPSTRLRLEELKKYLNVYDHRKAGLKMEQVIKELAPAGKGDVHREFNRFQKKAKKIIENVEKGIFPGKY